MVLHHVGGVWGGGWLARRLREEVRLYLWGVRFSVGTDFGGECAVYAGAEICLFYRLAGRVDRVAVGECASCWVSTLTSFIKGAAT